MNYENNLDNREKLKKLLASMKYTSFEISKLEKWEEEYILERAKEFGIIEAELFLSELIDKKYHVKKNASKKIFINQHYKDVETTRSFHCRYCGDYVYVDSEKDKRVCYCSAKCEKQYWRARSKMKPLQLKNYSAKDMALKLWREKKEAVYG